MVWVRPELRTAEEQAEAERAQREKTDEGEVNL